MNTISTKLLIDKLLQNYKIIDVRAPIEFAQGELPNSINLPLLNDDERALIGTCYKKSGREKAIELGYQIVSGPNKDEKVMKWQEYLKYNPHSIITCFRGGLRSQTSQKFLAEQGIEILRVEKGYKEIRQFFTDELNAYSESQDFRVLTGKTGSGKTKVLKQLRTQHPAIDLEDLAKHKGSAFGATNSPQPAQASFENNLSFEVLKHRAINPKSIILYEDESRLIGRVHLPDQFFEKLRSSRVIKMNVSLEERIENIFSDYIFPEAPIFDKYLAAVSRIEKKLGGKRTSELQQDLSFSKKQFQEQGLLVSNKIWIEKILTWYYDPMYTYSFDKRNPLIEFEGCTKDVINYLMSK
ncbi:MAG: tRNA 2-selenouridine(34) synthase MnmH [Bdellovibrionota bacterium]